MFTIFHLAQLMGKIFGVCLGAGLGFRWLGVGGGILGGLAGFIIGHIIGTLPGVICLKLLLRDLKKTDSVALRGRLDKEYYLAHLIIAELIVRGEPVESFTDYVSSLRSSDSPDRKRFGERVAEIWPEIVNQPASSH